MELGGPDRRQLQQCGRDHKDCSWGKKDDGMNLRGMIKEKVGELADKCDADVMTKYKMT